VRAVRKQVAMAKIRSVTDFSRRWFIVAVALLLVAAGASTVLGTARA
jgi:hypothetical protein